jgi:hypothetical protein
MPGSQRETRARFDLNRLQDTWILLEETLMNTVRLFAFVTAVLITTFRFGAISYGVPQHATDRMAESAQSDAR